MKTDPYLEVFLAESWEYLQAMKDGLSNLEKRPADSTVVAGIFRAAHTLKGMSATMGYRDMANLTHQLENVLDEVRNGQQVVEATVIDELLRATDELKEMVENIAQSRGDTFDVPNIALKSQQAAKLQMLPLEQGLARFPQMVRDLAKKLGKSVQLNILGSDTELGRNVIDEIGSPLLHLLRNALDHGIEPPDVREASDKPSKGTVNLQAFYSGDQVWIEVKDDGAGIRRETVLEKALEKGVITKKEAAGILDRDVYELLFTSGFSTAGKVSEISGRGVGLDVVKYKIESLGGRVEMESLAGCGTTFTIQLPLFPEKWKK